MTDSACQRKGDRVDEKQHGDFAEGQEKKHEEREETFAEGQERDD